MIKLGGIHTQTPIRSTNLAVELWDPVPLGLVKPHRGPHALIATVITTCPTWSTGTKKEALTQKHKVTFRPYIF